MSPAGQPPVRDDNNNNSYIIAGEQKDADIKNNEGLPIT